MLGSARGVDRDAAPLRCGRVARAADAADEPADEHRGPEAAGTPGARAARPSLRRSRARGARDARPDHRPARARARRREPRARRPCSVDEIVETAVERARARFPNVHFNAHLEPTTVEGIPDAARARRLEPARERREVDGGRLERRRDASRTASCACATTARASQPRIASTSSTASTAPRPHARYPAPASGSRSSARSPRRTAAASPPRTRPGGGALLRLRFARFLGLAHLRLIPWVGFIEPSHMVVPPKPGASLPWGGVGLTTTRGARSSASSIEPTMRPRVLDHALHEEVEADALAALARMSVSRPTMPFFVGSDCMSPWNMPISQAVPSSIIGPSRIASDRVRAPRCRRGPSRRSPRRSRRLPSASSCSCGTKTSMPSARSRAAHSSMKPRSYGVKSGPAK